ncbi:MAG: HAD family hydrolase [Chloroflexi bacterium]|nr:HAD family hydrolase [Chloroflexota bacterium]
MRRAVFLDRDGVINRAIVRDGKPYPPSNVDELEIVPGAADALARLRDAGYHLVVVTNQPDVARGTRTKQAVEEIHEALVKSGLAVDAFKVCYHDDIDQCNCRKPAPGLLLTTAQEEGIDLTGSFMVGDRWRDVEAGQRAGCTTLFIDRNYAERKPAQPYVRVGSLPEAAEWILSQEAKSR